MPKNLTNVSFLLMLPSRRFDLAFSCSDQSDQNEELLSLSFNATEKLLNLIRLGSSSF
jgi:hypothetical protein